MTNYQQIFDEFVFATYEDIRVDTLERIAYDLGVSFDPEDYDHET